MSNSVLIAFSLLLLASCTKNKTEDTSDTLIGKWQLIEEYVYDINSGTEGWVEVSSENSCYFSFNEDSTFKSSKFDNCTYGTYTYNQEKITITFGCEGFTIGIETPPGTFTENYKFSIGHLFLTPTYMSCPEGCNYKFKKTANEQ